MEKTGVLIMTVNDIIEDLKNLSSKKYKENVTKLGIPIENSIGVSTGDIRKLSKGIPKSNTLAMELWNTGYHEAKLLSVLLFDKKTVSLTQAGQLMDKVFSWDLCDHLCKNLITKISGYQSLIFEWCNCEQTYFKRGAFTLIASTMIYEKSIDEDEVESYLQLIKENSMDEREHVKKAVSWALREIGKKDFNCQEKAILTAYELKESSNKSQMWIGKDALKEIENLVQVEGRGRLISANSKMGKGQN